MRFTSPVQGSHMPQGVEKTYLGWWGDLGSPKQKITSYSLSQNQQKAMGGAVEGYLIHGTKRLARHFPYWGPPLIGGYVWYDWANKKYDWYNSKEGHHQTHLEEEAAEHAAAAAKAAKAAAASK